MKYNIGTRVRAPANNTVSEASYDTASLNPSGRVVVDVSLTDKVKDKVKKHFIPKINKKIKDDLHLSTYNVRSLKEDWKKWELVTKAEKYNISIMALQEHRVNSIKPITLNGYKFLLAPPQRNTQNATIGGLGFVLSPWAQTCYVDHNIVSNNIMAIKFSGHLNTHIINCHSPHNSSSDYDIEIFYSELGDYVDSLPKHDLVIITADFNAHLGKDLTTCNAFYDISNRNGKHLNAFCMEHRFTVGASKFPKKLNKSFTWTSPKGDKNQLDHILIRSRWQNSLRNVESYISPSVASDHRIVTATVRLSLRVNKRTQNVKRYDWSLLKTDNDILSNYKACFNNRFKVLMENHGTADEDYHRKSYTAMIEAVNDSAKLHLPAKKKSSLKVEIAANPEYKAAQEERDLAVKKNNLRKTRATEKALRQATLKMREIETSIQERHVNQTIGDIDKCNFSSDSAGAAWKLVNELTDRKPRSNDVIRGYDSKSKRHQAWVNHYSNLLYNPSVKISLDGIKVDSPLPICTTDFTKEEYDKALKQTRDTFGNDGIPSLLYKTIDTRDILLPVFNDIMKTGKAPSELLLTAILPIPKGNSTFIPNNSRGISILPVATKLLNRMILNRVRDHLEPQLRYNQNGFRPGRGTREHIFALRRIIEEAINYQLPCVITFIDFSKAFDCIIRSFLPHILAAYGTPLAIIRVIMALYTDTKAQVLTPEGATIEFLTNLGILQGDVLAPFIFILVLDFILRLAINNDSPGFHLKDGLTINDLDFADDIATVAKSLKESSILCQQIADVAAKFGLNFNIKKTQYMSINIPRPRNIHERVEVNGVPLEEVNDFKYLGAYVGSTTHDIKVRKGLAWKAMSSLDVFWKSDMSRKVKLKIFRAAVEPVLLYGCETWTLKTSLENELDGVYTRLLRRALNITWRSHTTNKVLYGNIPYITTTICKRRMKFAGHMQRHDDQPAHHLLFWTPPYGKRYRGRPFLTYPDVLRRDTKLSAVDLGVTMMDRDKWRAVVEDSLRQREVP